MKKKNRKSNKYSHKTKKYIFICSLLGLLVGALSYTIYITNLLEPKVDEVTANYISFNNKNATDMLKISNMKKMSDKLGKSAYNNQKVKMEITGEENSSYEIIIYTLNNQVDEQYINCYLEGNNETVWKKLSELEENSEGGKILFKSTSKNKRMTLKMWIDNDYTKDIENTAFEIKIKSSEE